MTTPSKRQRIKGSLWYSLFRKKQNNKSIIKLEDLTGEQTEFREELWVGLVDHIHMDEKSSIEPKEADDDKMALVMKLLSDPQTADLLKILASKI